MKKKLLPIAVAIALVAPLCAHADDNTPPTFTFSGFGTLGAVQTNTDLGQYVTSILQPKGATKDVDFGVDSMIAGQVNVRATDNLSFVGQVVANRTADDDYMPHVEWAFGRYAITPDLSVRAGILAVPVFLQSDSRLVGFANPWVRPPTAVYSQAPFTNYTGADLVYRHAFGDTTMTVQPYFGKAIAHIPITDGHQNADLDNLVGLNISGETGAWTYRASYFQTKLTYKDDSTSQLFDALRQIDGFVPGAADLADSLDSNGKKIQFAVAGVSYDSGNILFQAEYAKRKCDFFLSDTSSYYATFGYRFGNVMPHITVSQVKVDSPLSQNVVPVDGPFGPLGQGVNGLLLGQNTAQKAVAMGVRWQFARNFDAKLQWDRIALPDTAIGNFTNTKAGFAGSTVNVYSAAVDFVF
jgi:hypothetical protein